MKLPPMEPAEALRRAEALVLHDYRMYGTDEGRRIMRGLLVLLDQKATDSAFRKILEEKPPDEAVRSGESASLPH